MQIEVLGLIAFGFGLLGWVVGPGLSIPVLFVSTLLGAAAAITVTSLGDANIQPAHLMLGFVTVAALANRDLSVTAARALSFPRAGFWLLLTGAYAAVSAVIFPRLFAGATYVFAIARTEIGPGIIAMPLAPTSGNITQTVYFLGDIVCFVVFYAYACKPAGLKAITYAAIAAAALDLAFAAIDLGGYWTGAGDLLAFLRNGSYRMLDDTVILDFKRIVGSFPEASTFAYFTLGFFAFCAKLWLDGIKTKLTGPLAFLLLVTLFFSTSSTGYVGTAGLLAALFVTSLVGLSTGPVTPRMLASGTIAPLLVAVLLIGVRLDQPVWNVFQSMVEKTLLDKATTQSGIEREKWNVQALTNFSDTEWLGGGVGSVRASSFPIAVLGNIGAIGAATYASFLFVLLFRRKNRWAAPFPAACQSAARWACLAQLIGASVSSSFIDLALPFFIFAGLACAGPEPARSPRTRPAERPLVAAYV
jgi:hypothetical protein